jgi:hypothetical protein
MRIVVALVFSALLLSGCSAQEPSVSVEASPEEVEKNEWMLACQDFSPQPEDLEFQIAYNSLIQDVCGKADPASYDIGAELSPTVSIESTNRYLDAETFHGSYWAGFMDPSYKKKRFVFTELDQTWWEEKQVATLVNPDLGWFTSKDEGWHCRVEADIFCPKNFISSETIDGIPTEFRIIGTGLQWQDWQRTNSAHEVVHLYQDSHEQSHWSFWYIEGQATFYELAMANLLFNSNKIRRDFLFENRVAEDTLVFEPTSPEYVAQYFDDCDRSAEGSCHSFRYGVGSMFHEKLVIDYGLDTYWEWQDYLNTNMPKGDMANFSNSERQEAITVFGESFDAVFGLSRQTFEREVMASYIFEYFTQAP